MGIKITIFPYISDLNSFLKEFKTDSVPTE